jgi:hypothetical protein
VKNCTIISLKLSSGLSKFSAISKANSDLPQCFLAMHREQKEHCDEGCQPFGSGLHDSARLLIMEEPSAEKRSSSNKKRF